MVASLSLFPARVRFANADGTLTNEAYRALQSLFIRVGGSLGDFDFNTLNLTGSATIGGKLILSDGTVTAPSLYWGPNTSTGFYRIGTNNVGYTVNGTKVLDLLSTGLTITGTTTSTSFVGAGTGLTGIAPSLTAGNVTTNADLTGMVTSVGNATTVVTNANLTGEVTSVGNAATVTNPAVIGKVLTGYVSGAGTVAATDTILQAIQKLNGNNATNANLTGPITSVGNATSVAAQTGAGSTFVMNTSPTLVTPDIGVATGTSLTTTRQVASASAGALTVPSISARFNAANLRIGFGIANSNGFPYVGVNTNTKAASDVATYDITQAAAQLRMDNDTYLFNLAPSGTAGADITWTTAATLTRTTFTVPGTIVSNGTITSGVGGGLGIVRLTNGDATRSGYVSFNGPNGFRTGYIGDSLSAASTDTGIINYVAGSHAFTSTAADIASVVGSFAGQTNFRVRSTGAQAVYTYSQNSTTGTTTTDGFAVGIHTDGEARLINQENSAMVLYTNGTERLRIAAAGTIVSNNSITVGVGGGLGIVRLTNGDATRSGYVSFNGPNGFRTGYIGDSLSSASTDTGIINYVAGGHAFTSTAADIADFIGTFTGQTNFRIRSTGAFGAVAYFQNSTTGITTSDGFAIGTDSTSAFLVQRENAPITFSTNSILRMTISAAGNLSVETVGTGLRVKEGSNAKQGTAVLVAGSVVVSNTSVTANSRIFLTSQVDGGTPGFLRVSTRAAGTSFTITSSSGTDTSTVAYQIFEPA